MESFHPEDVRHAPSILGSEWQPVYEASMDFQVEHFEKAMLSVIKQPNVNSTIIMRADILSDEVLKTAWTEPSKSSMEVSPPDPNTMKLTVNLDDVEPRVPLIADFCAIERIIVRRIIPRNPLRDPVINQSCLLYSNKDNGSSHTNKRDTLLVVYVPHFKEAAECPFYLPPAVAVGILCHKNTISVHYLLFDDDKTGFSVLDPSSRIIRIALHLLTTAYKHSRGVMTGYEKRVHHDVVVDKVAFQNKYIELKQKYAKPIVEGWAENTDPKKHVFEDLAIAAFLITFWADTFTDPEDFQFVDLGCGNGLLVHLLISEGFDGYGIDARERKSWATYPENVRNKLKQQVIIPQILIDTSPSREYVSPEGVTYTYSELAKDPSINTLTDLDSDRKQSFIIGNHSDELTGWIPLVGCPFMVIPCCSHALSGAKYRFTPKSEARKSKYAALVDHVVDLALMNGWDVDKEILRIPSTRNAAIIGTRKNPPQFALQEILDKEGGGDGWIDRTMLLKLKNPRGH